MDAAEDRFDSLRMIRDSAAAVAPRDGDLRRVRALRFQLPGFDREVWREMCALGWSGLLVAEAEGGAGLGAAALCALAEELGWGLAPEPLAAVATIAPLLPAALRAEVLNGTRIVLPAWQERANSLQRAGEVSFAGGRLNGRKVFVAMASGADAFLVSEPDGLALLARDAPGVEVAIERTQDGGHFGTLRFSDAPAEAIAGDLGAALEAATLANAAYLLGVIDRALDITLAYLRTRRQFGRPIGSFQALQHRAADLRIQVALTRASVESAAAVLESGAPMRAMQAAVSRAKARAAEGAMLVTRQAIQLHGGIGYADEHDIGLFLRKAMVLSNLYGSAALHRARFMSVAPEQEDA